MQAAGVVAAERLEQTQLIGIAGLDRDGDGVERPAPELRGGRVERR